MPGVELLHLLSQFVHPPVSLNRTVTLHRRSESLTPLEREREGGSLCVKQENDPLQAAASFCWEQKLVPVFLAEKVESQPHV